MVIKGQISIIRLVKVSFVVLLSVLLSGMIVISNAEESVADTSSTGIPDCFRPVSPGGAAWRSAVFPGWGQYANGSYTKAGIMTALQIAFMAGAAVLQSEVERELRLSRFYGETSEELSAGGAPHYRKYSDLFDFRTDFCWVWGIYYIIAISDAYVDSYLYCFDKETVDFPYLGTGHEESGEPEIFLGITLKF